MSLKKYLLASGLSTTLVLGACNDETSSEEEASDEEMAEDETTVDNTDSEDNSENGDTSYSGEYGDYDISGYDQVTIDADEAEVEEDPESEGEADSVEIALVEFEFTNNSDVPTSPSEAFGMDLAVRQIDDTGEMTLDNLTEDIPEDHEQAEAAKAAGELIDPGETVTAVVGYGPVDTDLETVLQNRENPADEENTETLDETIELQ